MRPNGKLAASPARQSAGFSVIELTISLAVTVLVLLAVLELFDFGSKISRVQSNVSDMQQTQRIVHYELAKMIRMTGRGGLPAGNLPLGISISARDNVAAGSTLGGIGSPALVPGSDVLTLRGNFNSPVFLVNYGDVANPPFNRVTGPAGGTLRVDATFGVLTASYSQSLQPLIDAINGPNPKPEALLLISAGNPSVYVVVELIPGASSVNLTPPAPQSPNVVLGYRFVGGTNTAQYSQFSFSGPGVFPPTLLKVSRVSILEEYRYYLREDREIQGDNTSELIRRLSRAQTYLGTDTPYGGSATNWSQDIADNVLDLQFAYGINTTKAGCMVQDGDDPNCRINETADGKDDDWLYNDTQAVVPADWVGMSLFYVRMDSLVRTDKRDRTYVAPLIAKIENRDYTLLPANTATNDRMFRRRVLQTVVDLRNL